MKKMLIYSGHSEVVGGDVKFIVDYLNCIDESKFQVYLYTDKFCRFESLSAKWLTKTMPIYYLPTRPVVFADYFPLNILNRLEKMRLFNRFLAFQLRSGKTVKHVVDYLIRTLTLYEYRISIWNFIIFYRLFRTHADLDIFFFNNGGYPGKTAGLMACIVAKICRVPRVIMAFHNVPAARRPYSFFDKFIDEWFLKSVDKIISVSLALTDDIISKRMFTSDKIITIHCGLADVESPPLDHLLALRKSLNIRSEQKIILITGNLNEMRKGHEFLFKSLSLVKTHFSNFVLLVVGSGSDARLNTLKQEVSLLLLQDNVLFLGQRFDIEALNALADLVVVPSVGFEATPYTIKEGSRAGKPVITSDMGGCAEGVQDGVTGYVVQANNVEQLAERIKSLLIDENQAFRLGKAGRQFFLDRFEIQKKAKEIDLLLE